MRSQYLSFEDYRTSNPQLRYGQAFCTYYGIEDQSLFEETEDSKAIEKCALYIASMSLDA